MSGALCFTLLVTQGAACEKRKETGKSSSSRSASTSGGARSTERETLSPTPETAPDPRPLPEELPAGAPPPTQAKGGVLKVHLEHEPPHLNPLQDGLEVVDRVVRGLVYEPLVECRAGRLHPHLAERWETSADGLRVTLHLRGGARWHDDRSVTVLDAQATIEAIMRSTSRAPLLRASLADVAAVEILPERQIRLRLHRPSGLVLRALCDVPILPEAVLRGASALLQSLGRQPSGTGPYRFAGWERGRRIRLQRNGAYWGAPAALDQIHFEIDADGTRALGRVRRGELDVLPRLLDAHYPEQVLPGALGGAVGLYMLAPLRHSFLAVNHRKPPLDDPRLRRALSLSWNRGLFAEQLHRGLARPIGGPPWVEAPAPAFAPSEAARALDDAGLRDTNGDGVRESAGRALRIALLQPAGAKSFGVEARRFAVELRKLGLLLDLVVVDGGTLTARLNAGDFELAPARWEGRPDEDPRLLYGPGSAYNVGGYRSARFDAIAAELLSAPDPAARRPVFTRLGQLLAEELPVIFLYRHDQPLLAADRVRGLLAPHGELDLRQVWLDR